MGYVQVVGKQQLKRMLTRAQVQLGLGPPITEMDALSIFGHRQA